VQKHTQAVHAFGLWLCHASKPMAVTVVWALAADCARQVCMVLRYVADEITQYNDDIGVSSSKSLTGFS
jgi:hypothetical protein